MESRTPNSTPENISSFTGELESVSSTPTTQPTTDPFSTYVARNDSGSASRGSTSSTDSTDSTSSSTTTTTTTTTIANANYKRIKDDPLNRTFPAPAENVNLDEMLARKPRKWTLGHYIKETPTGDLNAAPSPTEEKGDQSAAFARAKAELLAARDTLGKLQLGGRP